MCSSISARLLVIATAPIITFALGLLALGGTAYQKAVVLSARTWRAGEFKSKMPKNVVDILQPSGKRNTLTVRLEGGLGNQFFMIASLLSAAIDSGYGVSLPNVSEVCCGRPVYWNNLFSQFRSLLSNSQHLPPEDCIIREERRDSTDSVAERLQTSKDLSEMLATRLRELAPRCGTVLLAAYAQNLGFFERNVAKLADLFIDGLMLQKFLAKLTSLNLSLDMNWTTLHYRFGDRSSDVLSDGYYLSALLTAHKRLSDLRIVIVSDNPAKALSRCHALAHDVCSKAIAVPATFSDWESFLVMAVAPGNIIAHSSFSFSASYIGEMYLKRHTPDLRQKAFVVTPRLCPTVGSYWNEYRFYQLGETAGSFAYKVASIYSNGSPAGWISILANTTTGSSCHG